MDGTRGMSAYEWAAAKQQQKPAREKVCKRIMEATPDEEFTVIITSPVTGIGIVSTKLTVKEWKDDVNYANFLLEPMNDGELND